MFRGIHKQMIVIKPPALSPFESALFILRHDRPSPPEDRDEMVREARRIINDAASGRNRTALRRASARRLGWVLFGLGVLCGALAIGLLWLLL